LGWLVEQLQLYGIPVGFFKSGAARKTSERRPLRLVLRKLTQLAVDQNSHFCVQLVPATVPTVPVYNYIPTVEKNTKLNVPANIGIGTGTSNFKVMRNVKYLPGRYFLPYRY
jgi:hypothetical protein